MSSVAPCTVIYATAYPVFCLISVYIGFLQQEDMEKVDVTFKPSFPNVCDFFCLIIDHMIISVKDLPRIEHLLFQSVEDLEISTIRSVVIEEELVEIAKERIRTVVMENSHGPNL